MILNKYLMPVIAIVMLVGTILTGQVAGYWQTSGREMIDPNQEMTSSDIRGWMSLELLSEEFDIPMDELRSLLNLPPDTPPAMPLKELEEFNEVTDVRTLIGKYLGESISEDEHQDEHQDIEPDDAAAPPEETALPSASASPTAGKVTATPIPTKATPDKADEDDEDDQDDQDEEDDQDEAEETPQPTEVVATPRPTQKPNASRTPGSGDGTGSGPTPLPAGEILPAADIKGRMTLQEVSEQCNVPLEVLYTELDLSESISANMPLKELIDQLEGFEVQLLRDVVANYQAAHK
jgi:hypothetical protein